MTGTLASCDIAQDMLLTPLEIERLRAASARIHQLTSRANHGVAGLGRAQMRDPEFLRAIRAFA
jgi:hypothetical protein